MLVKSQSPRSKPELIKSLKNASYRSFEVYEGDQLSRLPSLTELKRLKASVLVLRP
jgi:hypothetical protein